MTEIRPFKAVYYNQDKIKDISRVVCPPYDVISAEQQEGYYKQDPHNFIRILLGKDRNGDDAKENKYTRAKKIYSDWLDKVILKQDDTPCIYFYKQEYRIMGEKYSRLGFIALMKIQDDEQSKIFPHENIHLHAKEDRLRLWGTLASNLSSIFVCFSDKGKKVEQIFNNRVVSQEALINVVDDEGVRHLLWRFADPARIQEMVDALAGQPLFIADGHHRYEVAKEYRRMRRSKDPHSTGQEPYNYLMTYFTNMDSKELKIFPMHRIIKKFPDQTGFLEEFFRIDKISSKDEVVILLAKAGKNEHAFVLFTRSGIKLLRLKNKLLINQYVPQGSDAYRRLDATILKYFILDKVGVRSEDIIYTKDLSLGVKMVEEGEADASFIMNPVHIQHLKEIALNGERMPPKTTYFYPKVLSGLTIHKME